MPYHWKAEIADRNYIVVHAGYGDSLENTDGRFDSLEQFFLYAREESLQSGGAAHSTIIAGHTPTTVRESFAYNAGKDCVFYDIDCGYETYRKQFPQESKPTPREHLLASSPNFEKGGILVVKELLEEKIEQVDAKVLKKVIKERGENDIPIALKGLSIPAKKKLFSALPEHKADELAEECESMGPVRAIDVMAAFAELAAVFNKYQEEN